MSYNEDGSLLSESDETEKDEGGFGFDLDEAEEAFDDEFEEEEIPEGFHEDFGATDES